jgi:hypothetical protein
VEPDANADAKVRPPLCSSAPEIDCFDAVMIAMREFGEGVVVLSKMGFLETGTLSYLYKTRWNIEKVFDEIKNKLAEKKSMGDL